MRDNHANTPIGTLQPAKTKDLIDHYIESRITVQPISDQNAEPPD